MFWGLPGYAAGGGTDHWWLGLGGCLPQPPRCKKLRRGTTDASGVLAQVIWEMQESALLDTTRQEEGRGTGSLIRIEGTWS